MLTGITHAPAFRHTEETTDGPSRTMLAFVGRDAMGGLTDGASSTEGLPDTVGVPLD